MVKFHFIKTKLREHFFTKKWIEKYEISKSRGIIPLPPSGAHASGLPFAFILSFSKNRYTVMRASKQGIYLLFLLSFYSLYLFPAINSCSNPHDGFQNDLWLSNSFQPEIVICKDVCEVLAGLIFHCVGNLCCIIITRMFALLAARCMVRNFNRGVNNNRVSTFKYF